MPEQDFSSSPTRPPSAQERYWETAKTAVRDDEDSLSLVAVLFAGLGLAVLLNTFVSIYPG